MKYFLRKKKWMAWVIMLTFLFTSIMPSNLMAGNSMAMAADSYTIAVGETQKISGTDGWFTDNHQWSSSNTAIGTGGETTPPEIQGAAQFSKTATRTGADEWQITMQIGANSEEIKAQPYNIVLVLDRS